MLRYDIGWYLAFDGNISITFVNKLTAILGIDEYDAVGYNGADMTYRMNRSLDIMMPIILTKGIGHKVDIFRDCNVDKFVVKISD